MGSDSLGGNPPSTADMEKRVAGDIIQHALNSNDWKNVHWAVLKKYCHDTYPNCPNLKGKDAYIKWLKDELKTTADEDTGSTG